MHDPIAWTLGTIAACAGFFCMRWRGGYANSSTWETGAGLARWFKWATPTALLTIIALPWYSSAGWTDPVLAILFGVLVVPAWYLGTPWEWPDDTLSMSRAGRRSWWSACWAMSKRGMVWIAPAAALYGAGAWYWASPGRALALVAAMLFSGALCPLFYEAGWQISRLLPNRGLRGFRDAEIGEGLLGFAMVASVWLAGGRLV